MQNKPLARPGFTKNKPAPWLGDYTKVQRQAHSTKAGPGRRHVDGQPHGSEPTPSKGAPSGFMLHTNPLKRDRRALIAAAGGIRQFKKLVRSEA